MIRREPTTGHGQLDRDRYLDKIRDRLKRALPTIPGEAPMIAGDPETPVTVPIPGGGVGLPHFIPQRPPTPPDGWGQGPAQPGDIIVQIPADVGGPGHDVSHEPGDHDIAVTLPLSEWRRLILEDLHLPDLRATPNDALTEDTLVWTSRSRTGSLSTVDKQATLKEALARSQAQQRPLTFSPDDLRYHSWVERRQPKTAAVVYLLRDISASMDGERQYLARATAWYLVAVLQQAYAECPVRFWVHDTEGHAVTEAEFLSLEASGGTQAAPAYQAMQAEMDRDYPTARYNRYVFHFTDGDVWDAEAAVAAIQAWMPTLRRFGVCLLQSGRSPDWLRHLHGVPGVRVAREQLRSDVVTAVRSLLSEEAMPDAG
jgi:uncharacterized sporulation protein YeaH/YhbH (DUF444 family)